MRRDSFSIAPSPRRRKLEERKGDVPFYLSNDLCPSTLERRKKRAFAWPTRRKRRRRRENGRRGWVGKAADSSARCGGRKGVGEKKREGLDVARRDDQFLGLENRFRMFSDFTLEIETNNGPILNLYSPQLHFLIVSSDYGTRMKWNEAIYPPE